MTQDSKTTPPWPDPPELAHMAPQFRLGYRQAQDDVALLVAAVRDLLSTRHSEISPYIAGKCDAIRREMEKLDARP